MKFVISISIFTVLLITTSIIKNKTRIIEKKISNLNARIFIQKKDINETQLDFFYLTSPAEVEKKLEKIGFDNYQPINHSKIFYDILDFKKIQNKFSNLESINEKKIQKK